MAYFVEKLQSFGVGISATAQYSRASPTEAVERAVQRAVAGVVIEDLRLPDPYHGATTRLFEKVPNLDLEVVSITGHKNPRLLSRSTQLKVGDLARKLG